MSRSRKVPRALRGIEAGRTPQSFGLDPTPGPGATRRDSLFHATTRRSAWRRTQARGVVAALLAGTAAWLALSAVLPHPVESGVPVVVAARDLALGARVSVDDVRLERRPASQRPGSAVPDLATAVGQVTSGPVGEGELLTATRFRGPSALAGLAPARVAMSIPLVDDGLLPALRAGDSVTVLTPGSGVSVATAAPVLSVTSSGDGSLSGGAHVLGAVSSGGAGARLVVGLTTQEATRVAASMGGATGLTGFVVALGSG